MENWIVALWVLLFAAVPVVALVLARRGRMKRAESSPGATPHRPHGQHRKSP